MADEKWFCSLLAFIEQIISIKSKNSTVHTDAVNKNIHGNGFQLKDKYLMESLEDSPKMYATNNTITIK
jgi:hypothetical protein